MENLENKYKGKRPFTVPDGYFDMLHDTIGQLVEVSWSMSPRKKSLRKFVLFK